MTPLKLSRLSEVLRLPVTRVETILQGSPAAVRQMEPEHVAQRLQELCSALGVLPKQAAFMVAKQPAYMLLTPLAEMRAKVAELSDVLGVPQAAVVRTAVTVPSILRRSTATIDRRVRAYSTLLRCSTLDVLHVMARGPEYLSDTPSSVRQRMKALGYVLRRPRCTIAAMLQARPDLVFMSGRVMNTKVNGLMCILNKQKHHVVTLVVKLPALLRCNLDAVRNAFSGLQALLRKREGFVYAMVCHMPSLLLLTPRGLHQRCAALRRCLDSSPEWCEQFAQLRPPGVAQLVLNRRGSLSAMMYLTQRRRAGAAPLVQLLAPGLDGGPAAALGEAWPDFLEWMERRRQYVNLLTRQQRAAMLGAGERAVRASRGLRQGAVGELVPALHAQLLQQQQGAPHQQQLQHDALSSAVAGASRLTLADAEAPDAGNIHLLAGGMVRGAGPGLAQRGAHVQLTGLQSAIGVLAPREGCSSSSGRDGSSSRTSSSSRSVECESGGTSQQDADGGVAADRGQQPGASASGRPPSWLQLQAEYRRSLQSRARRKAATASEQGVVKKSKTPDAPAASPPFKRARLRRKSQPHGVEPTAPTAPAVWGMATAEAAAPAQHFAGGSSSAGAAASAPVEEVPATWAAASLSLQPSGPLGAEAGGGGRDYQRTVGGGESSPGESSCLGSAAQAGSNLWRSENDTSGHSAGPGDQQPRHVLSGLLLPGRGQQPDAGVADVGMDGHHTASGSLEAACASAANDPVEGALAAQLVASRGSLLSQHADVYMERGPAAAGGRDSIQIEETGSSWAARPAVSHGGGDSPCSAHRHAVDPDARVIPLWLRLDSSGVRTGAGGAAHGGDSDGGYRSAHPRPEEGEAHCGRRAAAPSAEEPADGASQEVVVVVGDGSIRDIKGLRRDSHTLGLRSQESGGSLSMGQAQKLESALGATVPR